MSNQSKLLWNVREAGSALGISPWTIRLYMRQGKLRPVRVGRRVLVEPEECRRFLEDCKRYRGRLAKTQSPQTLRTHPKDLG
jgi:predicted site-specific integrase-resolvase